MSMLDAMRSAVTNAKPAAKKKGYGGIFGRRIAQVASTVLGRNRSMAPTEEQK